MELKEDFDVIGMVERIAEQGTAPDVGCSLFGTGHDWAFEKLEEIYLNRAFERGRSSEKYIVGAYGSGKTHFLRQFSERARDLDCVTSEVALNKDLDYTKTLDLYRQVANGLEIPGQTMRGIEFLLRAILARIADAAPSPEVSDDFVTRWIPAIDSWNLQSKRYQRILRLAFEALHDGNEERFTMATRWLGGEVTNREIAKALEEQVLTKDELALHGREAWLSLGQVIRNSTFKGTVVAFDEAEQGLSDAMKQKQRRDKVLSMMQSSLNATADLSGGSMLIIYAITADVLDQSMNFPALAQRLSSDPSFFQGNPRAPVIRLDENRDDPVGELQEMGTALVKLFYQRESEAMQKLPIEEAFSMVERVAQEVASEEPSVSSRRLMMKKVATCLMNGYDTGSFEFKPRGSVADEVE